MAILLGLVFLIPVGVMVAGSFLPMDVLVLGMRGFTLENYRLLLEGAAIIPWAVNSLVVVAITATLALLLSLTAGYALVVYDRYVGMVAPMIIIFMVLPGEVVIIPMFVISRYLGLVGTVWGAVLPRALSVFGIFLFRSHIRGIPREVIDAARIDGAGELKILFSCILPLCGPPAGVVALIYGVQGFQDYIWQLMNMKPRTLVIGLIVQARNIAVSHGEVGVLLASGTIMFIPILILFITNSKTFMTTISLEGMR